MLFENILKDLPGKPGFQEFQYEDINPLSKRQKIRTLFNPNEAMRVVHARLLVYLRSLNGISEFSTGSVKGSSAVRNVQAHSQNRFIYVLDLKDAYEHVECKGMSEILYELDPKLNKEETQQFLLTYCFRTLGVGLIMGAPASPDLFNIYASALIDQPLRSLIEKHRLTYTRYLDDLTFSSKEEPIGKIKRRTTRRVIESAGFAISHHKSRIFDLEKEPAVINGIGLELGGRTFLPRHYLKRLRGLLYTGIARPGDKKLRAKIGGMMGLFNHLTNTQQPNKTEETILELWNKYKR